ncbi:MAG: thiosulfate oxidation carrier protein SoxY [Pseudomonadota bacterium]
MKSILKPHLSRRQLLVGGTGMIAISALPLGAAHADQAQLQTAKLKLFGDRPLTEGRVTIKMPPIAENGFSVPTRVSVDSPMTEADHVKTIAIISPRNPVAELIQFELGPQAGIADVSTRIRLAGTQSVQAIAEMSDGTLWSGSQETVVTLAACVVL